MSDIREVFEAWVKSTDGTSPSDFSKIGGEYADPCIQAYWMGWQAALSANGGEAEPVAWVVFADNGNIRIWGREKPEAFPDAAPLYLSPTVKKSLTVQSEPIGYADPDSLNDYRAGDRLHIPVYRPDASAEWQSGIPVYLHPAPPSVAVPVPWPKKEDITEDMRAGFERLYRAKAERDGRTLERNEQGAYKHLTVDAGWVFYQRAWADALEAATPSVPENDAGADAVIQFKDELLKSVKPIFQPHIEGVCAVVLERLRTAGDEGE